MGSPANAQTDFRWRQISVGPSERISEPKGVFGFARLALGLVGAVIADAIVFAWLLFARRRNGGKPSNS